MPFVAFLIILSSMCWPEVLLCVRAQVPRSRSQETCCLTRLREPWPSQEPPTPSHSVWNTSAPSCWRFVSVHVKVHPSFYWKSVLLCMICLVPKCYFRGGGIFSRSFSPSHFICIRFERMHYVFNVPVCFISSQNPTLDAFVLQAFFWPALTLGFEQWNPVRLNRVLETYWLNAFAFVLTVYLPFLVAT